MLALLLDTGLDHRSTDAAGNTAAMLAAIQGHVRCVDMLLEAARMREGEVAMEGRDSLGMTTCAHNTPYVVFCHMAGINPDLLCRQHRLHVGSKRGSRPPS